MSALAALDLRDPIVRRKLRSVSSADDMVRVAFEVAHRDLFGGADPLELFAACGGGKQWVYFIQSGDRPLVKIGWTRDLRERVAGLQTGSPDRLRLLWAVEGDRKTERRLHRILAKKHHAGEWFVADTTLYAVLHGLVHEARLLRGAA